ncbi:MAG TPA: DUF5916 domain-containing protein [Pedobacter sp.]
MLLNLKSAFFIFLLFWGGYSYSQNTVKQLRAQRTTQVVKIDGYLNDEAWKQADVGKDFIELRPTPGTTEKEGKTTEVKILYDDAAIYVYARMNEINPDSIARQIVPRDQVGNADFIGVVFDTYHDKINGAGFYVTAAGSQFDAKYSQTGNEDENWNAVWFSAVKIDDKGWSAEMKIPYSALRFSSKEVQTWGINFMRRRQKFNQEAFWNSIKPKESGFINQEGELTNIENIKAPVRLSFSPYISNNTSHYPYNVSDINNLNSKFNGGMDVKYGLNNAFTLDMTLVPDFGQVQSDNRVLNLTPFDIKFDEKRQFFTEGTEMFNKGNLFYSRRIGIEPNYNLAGDINANEIITRNPTGSKLINATKISGRTSKGLGIGIFNAVTNRMFSSIKDTLANTERVAETQPLTNYNIFVLDQTLKNNSSVTFLNANTLRQGSSYDANVAALLFNINDKKNKYFISGETKMSHQSQNGATGIQNGINYELVFGKQSGSFNWNLSQELSDKKFNSSDLGFFTNNNYVENAFGMRYNVYTPGKWYNQIEGWMEIFYTERLSKREFQSSQVAPGIWIQFKNFWTLNLRASYNFEGNDFYESRTSGRVFRAPAQRFIRSTVNTNRTKDYQLGGFLALTDRSLFDGWGWSWGTWQTYRVNDKFSLNTEVVVEPRFNYAGWVDNYVEETTKKENIIFSRYDRQTVEAIFGTRYTFNPRMGLILRARHYWSERENRQHYSLNNDGTLSDYPLYPKNKNQNYNVFNIDMTYTWQFAPGSELNITYKNLEESNGNTLYRSYGRNFETTLNSPQNNSLSVKVLYYIDYLDIKKNRRKAY